MADPVTSFLDYKSAKSDRKAAQAAAETQAASAQEGIDFEREQLEMARAALQPYANQGIEALQGFQPYQDVGAEALQQQRAYLGLDTPEAQQQFIDQVAQSPEMAEMVRQGEEGMLQNASATGGLRGGNTQAALAQFRPAVLQNLIDQKYGRLGGMVGLGETAMGNLAQLGQASAAGQGSAGLQTAGQVASLLGQRGAAIAGGQLMPSATTVMLKNLANTRRMEDAQFGSAIGSFVGNMGGAVGGAMMSDERLKTNIQDYEAPHVDLTPLRAVQWDWRENGETSVGVIAQELKAILPEAVIELDDGLFAVDYSILAVHLIRALKEATK